MDENEKRFEKTLLDFVEGYAKKAATVEEVEALAAVAQVFVNFNQLWH